MAVEKILLKQAPYRVQKIGRTSAGIRLAAGAPFRAGDLVDVLVVGEAVAIVPHGAMLRGGRVVGIGQRVMKTSTGAMVTIPKLAGMDPDARYFEYREGAVVMIERSKE